MQKSALTRKSKNEEDVLSRMVELNQNVKRYVKNRID